MAPTKGTTRAPWQMELAKTCVTLALYFRATAKKNCGGPPESEVRSSPAASSGAARIIGSRASSRAARAGVPGGPKSFGGPERAPCEPRTRFRGDIRGHQRSFGVDVDEGKRGDPPFGGRGKPRGHLPFGWLQFAVAVDMRGQPQTCMGTSFQGFLVGAKWISSIHSINTEFLKKEARCIPMGL